MGAFGGVLIVGAGCLAVWLFVNPLPRVLATATWRGHLLFALLLGCVAGIGVLSSSVARARLLEEAGVIGVLIAGGTYWGLRRKKHVWATRVNGLRVVGMTLLTLGVIEGVGCIILARELARGHPVGPLLCVFFTVALLGSGACVTRVARRKDAN